MSTEKNILLKLISTGFFGGIISSKMANGWTRTPPPAPYSAALQIVQEKPYLRRGEGELIPINAPIPGL